MTKYLLIFTLLLGFSACGGSAINFQDGTWSQCTYSKPGGTSFMAPAQVGGIPLGYTEPDGTKVECMPISPGTAPVVEAQ